MRTTWLQPQPQPQQHPKQNSNRNAFRLLLVFVILVIIIPSRHLVSSFANQYHYRLAKSKNCFSSRYMIKISRGFPYYYYYSKTSIKSSSITMMTSSTTSTTTTTSNNSNPLSKLGLPEPMLLGSASFTRKLILKEMGIPFSKLVRPIDEKALGDRSRDASPKDLVLTVAKAKMDYLVHQLKSGAIPPEELPAASAAALSTDDSNAQQQQQQQQQWILLTGDQVVTCQGHILEKPESEEEAVQFVQKYATDPPSTVGSCVIHHYPSGIQVEGVDTATIYFDSKLDATRLVRQLVEEGEPVLSCAGGLMIEHPLVQEYVQRIDGTQDSVMGLSKDLVQRLLEELADILSKKQ
jgi:septum formation protein